MQDAKLRMAVVSADAAFRSAVAEVLHSHAEMINVVADLTLSAAALTAETIDRVTAHQPEVLLVDLNGDPATGLRMIRLLSDAGPARTVIATGPTLAPELLLEGMKSGITEYLPAPVDAHDLADSLRRAARRLGRGSPYAQSAAGHVVTFIGAKGGTGITTLATNSALHIQRQQGGRTLLLDLNLEGGNLAVAMGLKPRYSIIDLLENFHRIDESLLSSLVIQHESGAHVLAAPLLPESVPAVSADQARAALRLLRRHYDLIVIDLARPYTEYGRAAIDCSDVVFLTVVPDVLAIHGAKRLLPLIRKGIENRDARLEIVLNCTSGEDEIGRSDVEEALDTRVPHLIRRDHRTVLSSVNLGRPVTLNGGRSRYARDVKELCTAVHTPARNGNGATGVSRLLRGFGRRNQGVKS